MKKGGLEIGVLLIGALIIVTSLLVKFIFNLPATQTLVISNIIFSIGFLIYILYSIMTTNNLNKEIRGLNAHILGLKKEIAAKNAEITKHQATIKGLQSENSNHLQNLKQQASEIKELNKQLEDLKASQNNPGQ